METTTQNIIEQLNNRVTAECTTINLEERYNDSLNEAYDFEMIGGPFAGMEAARVLKEVDPIAYNEGLSNYQDGEEDIIEIDGSHYDKAEAEAIRDEMVGELESDADDAEECADDEEESELEENSAEYIAQKRAEAARLRADIKTLEAHSF